MRAPLYTSLSRIKAAYDGGELPPMTPLTVGALEVIDPAFVPGMGALNEDLERGLQCPLIGCGIFTHELSTHLRREHRELRHAVRVVRSALSLPNYAPLLSSSAPLRASSTGSRARKHAAPRARSVRQAPTIGQLNARNACPAQVARAYENIELDLGRSPTRRELELANPRLLAALLQLYGNFSWAILSCSRLLEQLPPNVRARDAYSLRLERVLTALAAWFEVNGELPSVFAITHPGALPLMPAPEEILTAFETQNWWEAMRRARLLFGERIIAVTGPQPSREFLESRARMAEIEAALQDVA